MATKKGPFAALEAMRDLLPPGQVVSKTHSEVMKDLAKARPPPARAVVRMERKGRGGKEVTVVDKLELKPAELETWCRDLKQALGCGGAVDGSLIVLQGDLRQRLAEVLTQKGIAKVILG